MHLMKLKKEIYGILFSIALLATFIGLWLHSVYKDELNNLKAEANVIFFNSLEEANDQLFVSRRFKHHSRNTNGGRWVEEYHDELESDTVIIIEQDGRARHPDIEARVMKMITRISEDADSSNAISVRINAHSDTEFSMESDSLIIVDFVSTTDNLSSILDSQIVHSDFANLKVQVLNNPRSDTILHNAFITNKGSLGNIFLGTNDYAAIFQNYREILLMRMIPEIIFSALLFIAIASAFWFIYKSLSKERRLAALKDDFISNMTHEFKTPISVVNVALEALEQPHVKEDAKKSSQYIDMSRKELERLTAMVDRLMNISHLDENPVEMIPVDLSNLVDTIVGQFSFAANQRNQIINTTFPEAPINILGSKMKLEMLVSNLLDNAVKYSNEGDIIDVNVEKRNKKVYLLVSDSGPGIPREYRDNIFEKFYRIPTKNIHDVKGYGVGLYHVRNIVEQHGGTIRIEDNEPSGTRIIVEFELNG